MIGNTGNGNMRFRSFVVLSIILVSGSARGASYCHEASVVAAQFEDCGDNEYVSEAAILCLQKIEAEVKSAQAVVSTSAAANAARSKKSQTGKQNNAMKDYNFSKETLDTLIARAKGAQDEVLAYEPLLKYPEDYNEPEITGMTPEAYLQNTACYQDNRNVLDTVLREMDYVIFDLEHARDVSEDLSGATNQNQSGLESVNASRAAGQTAGKGTAQKKGSSQNSQSDITGTKPKPGTK